MPMPISVSTSVKASFAPLWQGRSSTVRVITLWQKSNCNAPCRATAARFGCGENRYPSDGLNRGVLSGAYPADCLMIKLAGVLEVQFRFDARAIGVDGPHPEMKQAADLAGRTSVADQFENLELAVG